MSAWSVSVKPTSTPDWIQLLTNVIGGNHNNLYLPNAKFDVVNILDERVGHRGCHFTRARSTPDPAQWYPDPSLATGGLRYIALYLVPYVWFIHDKLGLTAYGFALDDDIGNVNAGGATNIAFAVGGLAGSRTRTRSPTSRRLASCRRRPRTRPSCQPGLRPDGPAAGGNGRLRAGPGVRLQPRDAGDAHQRTGCGPRDDHPVHQPHPDLTGLHDRSLQSPVDLRLPPRTPFFGTQVFQAVIPARTGPITRSPSTPPGRQHAGEAPARSRTSRSTARASTRRTRSRSAGTPVKPTARTRSPLRQPRPEAGLGLGQLLRLLGSASGDSLHHPRPRLPEWRDIERRRRRLQPRQADQRHHARLDVHRQHDQHRVVCRHRVRQPERLHNGQPAGTPGLRVR